jgi:hypothetical protein
LSGITVPGKTTMLRIGRTGNTCGTLTRCPLAPVFTTVVSGQAFDDLGLGHGESLPVASC